jgi:hypothetical protein
LKKTFDHDDTYDDADSSSSSLEFLGSLVGWLQDEWELPPHIPMVYEKDCATNHGAVATWRSSLSPNPIATSLYVEVITLYPRNEAFSSSSTSSSPIMAMVVLSKHVDATKAFATDLPPMLQNLFREAEQCIVKHLDRSLMDWITTTKSTSSASLPSQSSSPRQSSIATLENAKVDMWNDFIETHNDGPLVSAKYGALDAEIIGKNGQRLDSDENGIGGTTDRQPSKRIPTTTPSPSNTNTNNDFAVEAAHRIARNRKDEDFAVQAARRVLETRSSLQDQQSLPNDVSSQRIKHEREQTTITTTTTTSSSSPNEKNSVLQTEETIPIDRKQLRPPSLSNDGMASRSFAQTISRPQDFIQRRRENTVGAKKLEDSTSRPPDQTTPNGVLQKQSKPKRFPQLNIVSDEDSVSSDPVNDEKIQLANEVMDEIVKHSDNLSAEDLLNAVMQFGEEKKKEDTIGSGFVNGAFEKAKDLLREQHRNREERLGQQIAATVAKETLNTAKCYSQFDQPLPVSAEEELRRMFEAGESLADQRITRIEVNDDGGGGIMPSTASDIKVVNDLVSSNKEVSSYARTLEDELVELELRLNKSPDESGDGRPRNPVFDVLSGPEVYDRNVDPRVAVNWPGAAPDSKTNVRLPPQLTEAVSQARFAADLLSSLEEKRSENGETLYFAGGRQLSMEKVGQMRVVVEQASGLGLIDDPLSLMAERARLQMVIDELRKQPEERFREIASEYKDLLLSDSFVTLVKHRLNEMVECDMDALRWDNSTLAAENRREREVLGGLVAYAQLLLKEVQALGAQLESQQLEVIRSICKVAMDPSLQTEEDAAAALSDAVRDMRPMFDDAFVAYLKYAIAEEEARLARAGVLDDPDHTQWLYVLKIVQQGVYKEIARGISRYIDHIFYILRMETPQERRMLLSEIIDALPTMDVRPFVRTVESIAGALGDSARGEFDDYAPLGELANQILQLQHDTKELLPPERIAHMSRDADEWAQKKKEKLLEQRRLTKQRLKAAYETEHLDDTIEAMSRQGEVERFD